MAIQAFSDSLPMMLYRALDAVMPRFRRIFNQFGITEQQWRVLRVLVDEPRPALRELSGYTLIPAPSLVGVIDRLEKNGLVARERCSGDRRRVLIRATERGGQVQAELAPLVARAYTELMQSLAPREWIRLLESLEKLSAAE